MIFFTSLLCLHTRSRPIYPTRYPTIEYPTNRRAIQTKERRKITYPCRSVFVMIHRNLPGEKHTIGTHTPNWILCRYTSICGVSQESIPHHRMLWRRNLPKLTSISRGVV
ncbi:hypothetical protein F4778DRAFT_614502 [Xylariomycetidae sp. FL2044]|nr:hypothetical protein F4778DRAFT_614502 [Xylariomycetidae sp. FL2044]